MTIRKRRTAPPLEPVAGNGLLDRRALLGRGIMFAGNPDTVFRQVMEFYDRVGGFEHLILMGRSGFMTHDEAEKGIKLFAREVLPRLKEVVHHRD